MKFEQLKQELKNGVESIYYIYGEDEYAKDSALNQIKNSAISSFPELNYIVFNSDQIEEQSFFEALDSPPFLSEKKVVVLKMYGTKKLSFMDRLTEYLKTPSEFCVFVIVSSALTTLKGVKTTIIDCSKISEEILKKYVLIETRNNNATITIDAVNLLLQFCNGNMSYITCELKKCLNFTKEITTDTIKDLVSEHTEYQVYDFTDAIGRKQTQRCIEIMNNFLNNKNISPIILNLLYNHFRRLYYISISKKDNIELSEEFKIQPYAIKKLKEQLKFYNTNQLKNILNIISESDYKIKNGLLDLQTAIYNIVFSILTENV